MTTTARIGHGILFAIGDGAGPEVFTNVAEVNSVTPLGISKDIEEVTHTESPERYREYIGSLKDGGEVSIEMNFDPASASTTALLAAVNSDSFSNHKITFPDATAWTFSAICTGFETEAPVEGKMTATATFKLTGKPGFIS